MTDDIKDLLALAVPDQVLFHGSADAAADLARGQRTLRRRRLAAVAGAAVAAGAVAGGVVTGTQSGHPPSASRPPASAPATRQPGTSPHSIALVAYDGTQVPGYQVAEVPAGWTIQGGNAFVLTLAPIGDPNTEVDSFVGKLVVTTESASEVPGQPGAPESVNGEPGRYWAQGDSQTLIYRYTSSTWVSIQAPASLGWDAEHLVAFADGVKVLGNAQQSKG